MCVSQSVGLLTYLNKGCIGIYRGLNFPHLCCLLMFGGLLLQISRTVCLMELFSAYRHKMKQDSCPQLKILTNSRENWHHKIFKLGDEATESFHHLERSLCHNKLSEMLRCSDTGNPTFHMILVNVSSL